MQDLFAETSTWILVVHFAVAVSLQMFEYLTFLGCYLFEASKAMIFFFF